VVGGVGNGVSWWWLWVVSWLNEPNMGSGLGDVSYHVINMGT
jgi:hypothetical protein